jgi:hypothetical protein
MVAEGATAQAVLLVAAAEVEDGGEVDVEAHQPEHAGRERAVLAGQLRTPRQPDRLGRRHRRADFAEAVNQAALLIHSDEHAPARRVAYLRVQERDLLARLDVAAEQDDAAGAHLAQQLAQPLVERRARQADEQKSPGLALQLVGAQVFNFVCHRR